MGNKNSTNDNSNDGEVNESSPSYWAMMKQGYNDLVHAIIRPPRCNYSPANLGPKVFDFCGKTFERTDFELRNPRGLKIVCSMWGPIEKHRPNPILPCVIYMHGNSSARMEALPQLSTVLSLGATLMSFDFTGSGLSEGEYVSLGAYEKEDLKTVIEHLRSTGKVSTIALWGRSMGAATALLHGERDPSIAGMVLDSAFADLTMLAEEMVEKGRQHGLFAPSIIVKIAIRFIRSSVMKLADFDIRTLSPIEHADKCFIPALFIAAEGDEFVPPHHSQRIYHKYAGDKNVIIVEGDHNSPRPKFMFESVSIFLGHTLQIPEEWILLEGQSYASIHPWNIGRNKRSGASRASQVTANSGSVSPETLVGAGGLSLDEILALSLAESSVDVGMTQEKQDDMRKKVYRMFGDQKLESGTKPTAKDTADPSPRDHSNIPKDDQKVEKGSSSLPNQDEMWPCPVCTLLNIQLIDTCAMCGYVNEGLVSNILLK